MLLEQIGTGTSFVHPACRVARAAWKDGNSEPIVQKLAFLGSFGNQQSHEERDLHRWLSNELPMSWEVMTVPLTLQEAGPAPRLVNVAVYPPHEALHHMWQVNQQDGGNTFQKCLLGLPGTSTLQQYWDIVLQQPWADQHPLKLTPWKQATCIPILYHTDGAEFSNTGEAVCYTWASALSKGCSWDTKKLAVFLVGDTMVKWKTNREVVNFLNWSAKAMLEGCFPAHDPSGQPFPVSSWRGQMAGKRLAGEYYCAFAAFKADLKARQDLQYIFHVP